MREEDTSRIEAWFDGEASREESRLIEKLLDTDPEARNHLEQLQRTRDLLKASHPEISPPVSWEQLTEEKASRQVPEPARVLSFPRKITAVAAMLILGLSLWIPIRHGTQDAALQVSLDSTVELVETDLEDATPVVYLDQPSGWTVVWVVEDIGETGI